MPKFSTSHAPMVCVGACMNACTVCACVCTSGLGFLFLKNKSKKSLNFRFKISWNGVHIYETYLQTVKKEKCLKAQLLQP